MEQEGEILLAISAIQKEQIAIPSQAARYFCVRGRAVSNVVRRINFEPLSHPEKPPVSPVMPAN